MEVIPELVPISELRLRQNALLSKLHDEPVVLTQHGRAVAVLVSPSQWNQIAEELEELRDALEAMKAHEELRQDPACVRPWEEVESALVGEGLLDA